MKNSLLAPLALVVALVSGCADGAASSSNSSGGGGSTMTTAGSGGTTNDTTTSSGGAGGAGGDSGGTGTMTGGSGGTTTTSTTSTTSTTTLSGMCELHLCEGNLPASEWAPGCGYQSLVDQVIAIFPFCAGLWGDPCSMAAEWLGAPCQSTRMCTHRACESGAPLNPGCDQFEIGAFCDTHASCCTTAWDQQCVTDWIAYTQGGLDCQSTCAGPSPAGCLLGQQWGCADGYECVPSPDCKPSVCACDGLLNGTWLCTPDCDGGVCAPK